MNLIKGYPKSSDINLLINRGDGPLKKTKYGYIYNWSSAYVSLYNCKIHVLKDGRIKMKVRVRRNYQSEFSVTHYFDKKGEHIIAPTRKALAIWKAL